MNLGAKVVLRSQSNLRGQRLACISLDLCRPILIVYKNESFFRINVLLLCSNVMRVWLCDRATTGCSYERSYQQIGHAGVSLMVL